MCYLGCKTKQRFVTGVRCGTGEQVITLPPQHTSPTSVPFMCDAVNNNLTLCMHFTVSTHTHNTPVHLHQHHITNLLHHVTRLHPPPPRPAPASQTLPSACPGDHVATLDMCEAAVNNSPYPLLECGIHTPQIHCR